MIKTNTLKPNPKNQKENEMINLKDDQINVMQEAINILGYKIQRRDIKIKGLKTTLGYRDDTIKMLKEMTENDTKIIAAHAKRYK